MHVLVNLVNPVHTCMCFKIKVTQYYEQKRQNNMLKWTPAVCVGFLYLNLPNIISIPSQSILRQPI